VPQPLQVMESSQQVPQTQMMTYGQPLQQVVPHNQGYYVPLPGTSPRYQEENEPEIVSAKMVKEENELTKHFNEIEEVLLKQKKESLLYEIICSERIHPSVPKKGYTL